MTRTKDFHHLRIPNLPESAAAYRTWRNAVRTALLSYDLSDEGALGQWLSKAFSARNAEAHELAADSEGYPMVDHLSVGQLAL